MSRACEPIGFEDSRTYILFGVMAVAVAAFFLAGVHTQNEWVCGVTGVILAAMAAAFLLVHWAIIRDLAVIFLMLGGLCWGVWQAIVLIPKLGQFLMQGFG